MNNKIECNIRQYAFTVAEAVIAFIIMGAVFMSSASLMKRKENYNKSYMQAYSTLHQASKLAYDAFLADTGYCECSITCGEIENCYMPKCWRNQNSFACQGEERKWVYGSFRTININRDYPGFLFNDSTHAYVGIGSDEEFCKALIKNINVLPSEANCKSFISAANKDLVWTSDGYTGVNFLNAFKYCTYTVTSNGKNPTPSSTCSDGLEPSFVAANGQRYYISAVTTANYVPREAGYKVGFEHNNRESYRFVVVDLNGDISPNTQFKIGDNNPDTVLFAINSKGDVIPLGYPEFSKTYMNTSVYCGDGTKSEEKSYTLWDAKKAAWGLTSAEDTQQIAPYESPISNFEPLSQSAKLYAAALGCIIDSAKYNSCTSINNSENDQYSDELFINLIAQFSMIEKNVGGSKEFYQGIAGKQYLMNDTNICNPACQSVRQSSMPPSCKIGFNF